MGDNKDVRRKLEGQFRAYHEHVKKRDAFKLAHEKVFAQKTINRVLVEIKALNAKLSKPMPCSVCKRTH